MGLNLSNIQCAILLELLNAAIRTARTSSERKDLLAIYITVQEYQRSVHGGNG